MMEGFRKAFPEITLEWFGSRMAEVTGKLEAERRGGVYSTDVLIGGTSTANLQMKPMGALDPLRPALILPEVTDPTRWLDGRLDFSDRDEMNLVFAILPIPVLLYDPRQVMAEDVDELYELLAPRWQGKIVLSDPLPQGAGQATARWIWEMLGPEKGAEYIRALRAQAGAVDRDLRRQAEWIARGRYAILVGPGSGTWQQFRNEGLTFGVMVEFKDYGTHLTPGTGTVMRVNRAPHPNAATVFINWLLTREGQTAYSTGLDQPSRRLDTPTDHLPDEVKIRPNGKYWTGYHEQDIGLPAPLDSLLREQFGR
jgi:iron(III) transport system substrate-binding protein